MAVAALTGAVDERREEALREFGADEVVLADADEELLAAARERFAVPVSPLG